ALGGRSAGVAGVDDRALERLVLHRRGGDRHAELDPGVGPPGDVDVDDHAVLDGQAVALPRAGQIAGEAQPGLEPVGAGRELAGHVGQQRDRGLEEPRAVAVATVLAGREPHHVAVQRERDRVDRQRLGALELDDEPGDLPGDQPAREQQLDLGASLEQSHERARLPEQIPARAPTRVHSRAMATKNPVWARIGLAALVLLLVVALVLGIIWRRLTALPDWYDAPEMIAEDGGPQIDPDWVRIPPGEPHAGGYVLRN